ncbi:MAG TPA: hypothetical protein VFV08_13750 [Puia sp.]|nr:hypothetical protein [Puia sp.]
MKRLLLLAFILTGTLVATRSQAQVYVHANVGFGLPAPRVYCEPAPAPVIYSDPYAYPQPVYPRRVIEPVVVGYGHGYWYGHDRYRSYPRYERRERFHEREWRHRHW